MKKKMKPGSKMILRVALPLSSKLSLKKGLLFALT